MSKGISKGTMLSVLPSVLTRDKGMRDLAELVGWIVEKYAGDIDAPAVFQHIEELDTEVLDILAKDCKVDWFDYDADPETKKKQIASNWQVRAGIGTVSAVKTALQNVWPDSTVEEWFEYGGDPGYFRVFLGVDSGGTVDFEKAVRMLELFKPVRAHVDGYVGLRVTCGIVIETDDFEKTYHPAKCGTKPRRKSHGGKDDHGLDIGIESITHPYHVKYCGTPLGALM